MTRGTSTRRDVAAYDIAVTDAQGELAAAVEPAPARGVEERTGVGTDAVADEHVQRLFRRIGDPGRDRRCRCHGHRLERDRDPALPETEGEPVLGCAVERHAHLAQRSLEIIGRRGVLVGTGGAHLLPSGK